MARAACAITRASNPAPAITAKCSPLTVPVSSARRRPCSPTRTAAATSPAGMSRLDASRFAVPAGRIAITVPVPARASTQRWTVPSPPQTNIRSAPCSRARPAQSGTCLLLRTSYQSGSVTPSSASTFLSSGSPPPKLLRACATTATLAIRGSDLAPAGLAQPVNAEDQQPERGQDQQRIAERLVAQGQQGLVDATGLRRLVRDRRVDDQDAGQREHHAPGGGADHAEQLDELARPRAHLPGPQVFHERAADALDRQHRADDDHDQAGDGDQPLAAGVLHDLRGDVLLLPGLAPLPAGDHGEGQVGEPGV